MPDLSKLIKTEYKTQLITAHKYLKSHPHFLVSSPDPLILSIFIEILKQKNKKTIFINLKNVKSELKIKELYDNLEKSNRQEIKLVIFGSRIDDIDNMEKRVRSRFNNVILFLPYIQCKTFVKECLKYKKSEFSLLEKEYQIDPTLKNMQNCIFLIKNELKKIKLNDIFKILTNLQITICILAKKEKINIKNVVTKFRVFCIGVMLLKNIDDSEIINSFLDCKEFRLISESFICDWQSFEVFVKSKGIHYMIELLKRIK